MANFTPKKSNFLKQLFSNNPNEEVKGSEEIEFERLKYYSSLAKYHPDLIVVFSPEGELLSQNKNKLNEFIGFSPKHKIDYKELVSSETYNELEHAFSSALTGKSSQMDIWVEHKINEEIYCSLTFIPIKVSKKEIEGVYIVIKDATSQLQTTENLKLKEKHLSHAQQIAAIGSWEYDIDEDKLFFSEYFCKIFGFDHTDNVKMEKPFEFVHPDDFEEAFQKVNKAIETGEGYISEFRIFQGITNDLRYIKVQAEVSLKNDIPDKLIGVVKDETVQKLLENEMENKDNHIRYIFDNLNSGIWMRESIDGKIVYASKGLGSILNVPLVKIYDDPGYWKDMVVEEDYDEMVEAHNLVENGESIQIKFRLRMNDGSIKWLLEQTIPSINENGDVTHIFGKVTDITNEMNMHDQLEFMATHEPITALPNHHSLDNKFNEYMNNSSTETLAVLYMDLDNFNWINNYLGYKTGDLVLKKLSEKLKDSLPKDVYLSKSTNDVFIFLIPNYGTRERVEALSENILNITGQQWMIDDYELQFTASIGISFYPENGDDKATLLENAHGALYHAKRIGKNNYQTYSFDKNITSLKKFMLEKDLRYAIENDALELYYQPFVNPISGAIEGAESLIRWHHKDWGLIPPDDFIPIAEEKHLIHKIAIWSVNEVCKTIRHWRDKDYPVKPVSINLSPICFLKPSLVDEIKNALNKNDIPPKYLILEITERYLLQNDPVTFHSLKTLKEFGIKIALDDFGTGYSSISYLQEFDFDILKIDQAFIQQLHLPDNHKDYAIVSSLLHLSKGLDMTVIAEGVEEYEQLELLKQKECDLLQGYLYSKPVPLAKYEEKLLSRYLLPKKRRKHNEPKNERRDYFRFIFLHPLLAHMKITELNKKSVEVGYAPILIENISLGGLKLLTTLDLPINTDIKLAFRFVLMKKEFEVIGSLTWKNEDMMNTFSYGISFEINEAEKDSLAKIINRMQTLQKADGQITDTAFIKENRYLYLQNKL